jgi:hypothetical protein
MSIISIESTALHIVRHLVRGRGKVAGQGVSLQNIRHWWTMSLGQRGEDLDRGIEYASRCRWVESGLDNHVLLTSLGFAKGSPPR